MCCLGSNASECLIVIGRVCLLPRSLLPPRASRESLLLSANERSPILKGLRDPRIALLPTRLGHLVSLWVRFSKSNLYSGLSNRLVSLNESLIPKDGR